MNNTFIISNCVHKEEFENYATCPMSITNFGSIEKKQDKTALPI